MDKLDNDIHALRVKSSRLSSLIQKKTDAIYTASDSPGTGIDVNTGGYEQKIGVRAGLTPGVTRGSKPLVAAARTTGPQTLSRASSRNKVTSTSASTSTLNNGTDLGSNTGMVFSVNKQKEIEKEKIKKRDKDFSF